MFTPREQTSKEMDVSGLRFLIAGAGLFGAVLAERIANVLNEKVLVIEKNGHIGGNCYSEDDRETGIHYHTYGTHIFHTSDKEVWNYIHHFTSFNSYRHQVLTTYNQKVYQLPINLETINSLYNLNLKPFEAEEFIREEALKSRIEKPGNFEEKAISLIGEKLYNAFIKGYSLKQWQKDPALLPSSLMKRMPVRYSYDESYYNDVWQGIPENGYASIFEKLLGHKNITVKTNTDFFDIKKDIPEDTRVIYSGPIDRFFNYKYGRLEWRTLRFEKEIVPVKDYQGTAVMNFANMEIPYTRIHEPKHLHPEKEYFHKAPTLIIREYSSLDNGESPFYPVNDEKNRKIVEKYRAMAATQKNMIINGRLGDYAYYDMDQTIRLALDTFQKLKNQIH